MASSALPCPVPPLPSGASRAGCGWPSLLSLRRLPTTMVAQDRNSTSPITTPATSSGDTSRLVSPPSSPGLGKALEALLWFEAAAGRETERNVTCHRGHTEPQTQPLHQLLLLGNPVSYTHSWGCQELTPAIAALLLGISRWSHWGVIHNCEGFFLPGFCVPGTD